MKKQTILWGCLLLFLVTISLTLLIGCGGGGDGGNAVTTVPPAGGNGGSVNGTATKGPVANGTVTAFSISENGTKGSMIGSGITDGQGNFSLSTAGHSGPVMLQMAGGNYMDEASGLGMQMHQNDVITCVIPSMSPGEALIGIQMTPLTSMAQARAQSMPGGMTSANINAANTAVGNYFMVNDIIHTRPMDPLAPGSGSSADQNMRNYGMIIAAMSQYAKNIGMPFSSGMVTAMMNDAADGHMNGTGGTLPVMMGGGMMGGTMMIPDAGTGGLADAMSQFIGSPMNKSGLTVADMQNLMNKLMTSDGILQ